MNRTPVNFWSVLLPLPTSRGDSGLDSGEVVPIAQLFADQQEQTGIEAVRRSEGSRASFLYAETQRRTCVRIAILAMRPSS
jgi:hypothetical protein